MGTLLHSCVKMHEAIELLFMVVSRVSPGIGVLDGSLHFLAGRGGFFWGGFHLLVLMDFHSALSTEKCIRLMCEKLTIFPYRQYINRVFIKCSL